MGRRIRSVNFLSVIEYIIYTQENINIEEFKLYKIFFHIQGVEVNLPSLLPCFSAALSGKKTSSSRNGELTSIGDWGGSADVPLGVDGVEGIGGKFGGFMRNFWLLLLFAWVPT